MTLVVEDTSSVSEVWIELSPQTPTSRSVSLGIMTGILQIGFQPRTDRGWTPDDVSYPVSQPLAPGSSLLQISAIGSLASVEYRGDPEDLGFGWAVDAVEGYFDETISGAIAVRAHVVVAGHPQDSDRGAVLWRFSYQVIAQVLNPRFEATVQTPTIPLPPLHQ